MSVATRDRFRLPIVVLLTRGVRYVAVQSLSILPIASRTSAYLYSTERYFGAVTGTLAVLS